MVWDLDVLPNSNPGGITEKFPETANYLIPSKIHAFDITRVKNYGFFIILENNVTRMCHDYV